MGTRLGLPSIIVQINVSNTLSALHEEYNLLQCRILYMQENTSIHLVDYVQVNSLDHKKIFQAHLLTKAPR